VPTKENPADFATRGVAADRLSATHPWLIGPSFLWHPAEKWPVQPCELQDNANVLSDTTKEQKCKVSVLTAITLNSQDATCTVLSRLVNRCSSLLKAKRLTAWLLRAKQFLGNKAKGSCKRINVYPLSAAELKSAELELAEHDQRECFP